MEKLLRPEVADPGIDEAAKKLTPEQIQQTIHHVLTKECAARLDAYLETCVHCGLCANACHYCISHDYDPSYAPVAKVRNTMWEIVKRKGKVDAEFIKQAARIAFTECNVCRRCSGLGAHPFHGWGGSLGIDSNGQSAYESNKSAG